MKQVLRGVASIGAVIVLAGLLFVGSQQLRHVRGTAEDACAVPSGDTSIYIPCSQVPSPTPPSSVCDYPPDRPIDCPSEVYVTPRTEPSPIPAAVATPAASSGGSTTPTQAPAGFNLTVGCDVYIGSKVGVIAWVEYGGRILDGASISITGGASGTTHVYEVGAGHYIPGGSTTIPGGFAHIPIFATGILGGQTCHGSASYNGTTTTF